mmetsp:Transcript_32166/g.75172  ORF Transcript_32166/g.75172 Transcript_32166/m.75172 type:complete len:224 (-) Transcript_32166:102-773(-)
MFPNRVAKVDDLDARTTWSQVLGATPFLFAQHFALAEVLPWEPLRPCRLHAGQHDVLWLQVRMGIPHLRMQEVQGIQELLCNDLNVLKPKPTVVVLFDELVQAAAQRFKDHAEEPGVVKEGSVHPAATKLPPRISCTNSRQDLCLLLSGLSKLIDIANDLDRDLAFFVRQTRPNAPSPALECSRYLRFSTCPGSQSKCTIASCSLCPPLDESAVCRWLGVQSP